MEKFSFVVNKLTGRISMPLSERFEEAKNYLGRSEGGSSAQLCCKVGFVQQLQEGMTKEVTSDTMTSDNHTVGGFVSLLRIPSVLTILIMLAMGLWVRPLHAARSESDSPYNSHEMALMPPYCKYTQVYRLEIDGGNNPTEIARLDRLMGPSASGPAPMFSHMHHYCNAIYKTNRALLSARATQGDAKLYLKSSIEEFDYVIDRAPETFVLLPEILTKKAEALLRLTDAAVADARVNLMIEDTLTRAIRLKRDYWPAYAALSDYYKRSGSIAQARKALEDGLAQAPQAQGLKRRLAELKK